MRARYIDLLIELLLEKIVPFTTDHEFSWSTEVTSDPRWVTVKVFDGYENPRPYSVRFELAEEFRLRVPTDEELTTLTHRELRAFVGQMR